MPEVQVAARARPQAKPGLAAAVAALVGVAVASTAPVATARCWYQPEVAQLAQAVAERHFPAVAASMPEVLVCDHLPNAWSAMHTSGPAPRISVASRMVRDPYLAGILGHELAHHQVMLEGLEHDRSAGGHGLPFMRALLRAGLADEAQRVAQTVDGAGQALAQARATLGHRPPNPPDLVAEANHWRRQQPARVCSQVWVPVSRFVDQHGCMHTTWQLQTHCAH
jgi:hypothetical protein